MRGKVRMCPVLRYGRRITPAHAGGRGGADMTQMPEKDHPRACGEKNTIHRKFVHKEGSPPRMRGKGERKRRNCYPLGITPAHAGKSILFSASMQLCWDHPRACGEKLSHSQISPVRMGSPPRMRGKDCDCILPYARMGITPAHAGKSVQAERGAASDQDHPRACGEKTKKIP